METHSKMRRTVAAAFTALALGLTGMASVATAATDPAPMPKQLTKAEAQTKAAALVKTLTLDEKLGQMMWTHVYGADANNVTDAQAKSNQAVFGEDVTTPAQAVEKWKLGGVLYFNWSGNIGRVADLKQIATLSNDLQSSARKVGKGIPLALSIDQEGGIVARMRTSITDFPGNMALGATGSEELAYKQALINGRELRSVGINVDFAPDVDVNTNPANPVIGVRSYSSDPELVAKLGSAQVRGYQEAGVSATAKHFPGHGDTSTDSHATMPVVAYDRAELERHLLPFKEAIKNDVDMIMTAHVIVNAIDPGKPATLSHKILTELLREEMNYDGIITTDAIDMEGAQLAVMSETERENYENWKCKGTTSVNGGANTPAEFTEACVKLLKQVRAHVAAEAVAAGSDIVLNIYDVEAAITGLKDALNDGKLSQAQIDRSVERILAWKYARGVMDTQPVDPEGVTALVRTPSDLAVANDVISKMVTMVRNTDSVLPLPAGAKVLVTGSTYGNPEKLRPRLDDLGFETSFETTARLNPTDEEIAAQVKAAADVDYVVYTSFKASSSPAQQAAINALVATGKPVIVVATSVPYDSAAVPKAAAVLNIYGNQDPNHDGAAMVLSGKVNPTGKLPVAVPAVEGVADSEALPFGFGLSFHEKALKVARAGAVAAGPFKDVQVGDPFVGEIASLKVSGITTGWKDGTFRPYQSITREAFAAFLARVAKVRMAEDEYQAIMNRPGKVFTDYARGAFVEQVDFLSKAGVIKGWNDGTFRPYEPIARDATAAMFARMCTTLPGVCSADVAAVKLPQTSKQVFTDVAADNQFAAEIQWLAEAAITTGWPDGSFRPRTPIARNAMAAFVYRAVHNVAE